MLRLYSLALMRASERGSKSLHILVSLLNFKKQPGSDLFKSISEAVFEEAH